MTTRIQEKGFRSAQRSAAFTLAELLVAMAVLSMLVGAAVSAIVISTSAIPNGQSLVNRRTDAMGALERMAEDLFYATVINSTGVASGQVRSIVFEVDDRGHGASGAETIRYAWSGASGDPLIRQYNGGSEESIADQLDQFVITLDREDEPLDHMPVVLIMVPNSSNPSTNSQNVRDLIDSWDFDTRLISSSESQSVFETVASGVDVLYLTKELSLSSVTSVLTSVLIPTKRQSFPMGVVTEFGESYSSLGISTSFNALGSASQIDIVDNTHFITKIFATGTLNIFEGLSIPVKTSGTDAPDGETLAVDGGMSVLMAIDYDAELSNGGIADRRIVKMPWSNFSFDVSGLSSDGERLMRRAIVWAATPKVYTNATIKLQLTGDSGNVLRTRTTILNRPR